MTEYTGSNLGATCTKHWTRDLETTPHPVLDTNGYTKRLKPQFDEQKFEENYTTWEFEVTRYERDNNTTLPDNVKNSHTAQPDKRTIAVTLAVSRINHNIRTDQVPDLRIRASTAFARLQ